MLDKVIDFLLRLFGRGVKKAEEHAAADRAESEEIHAKVQAADKDARK